MEKVIWSLGLNLEQSKLETKESIAALRDIKVEDVG